MPLKRILHSQFSNFDAQLQRFASDVSQNMDNRRVSIRLSSSSEVAGVRTFTMQVIDRLNRNPISGRWLIQFWITETEWGEPGGDQAITITQGTLVEDINDNLITAATQDGGLLQFTMDIAVAGSRYVYIANLEELTESGVISSSGGGGGTAAGSRVSLDIVRSLVSLRI
jgi:hypothetical protein